MRAKAERVTGEMLAQSNMHQSAPGAKKQKGTTIETRVMRVPAENGAVANIPVISGNSFRGRCRRAMAQDLCERVGVQPGQLDLQITHLLFVGGGLAKGALNTLLPEMRSDLRNLLPGLSVFGGSILGTLTEGYAMFGDWVAQVRETPEPCLWPGTDANALPTAEQVMYVQRWVQNSNILTDVYGKDTFERLSDELKAELRRYQESQEGNESNDDANGGGLRGSLPYGMEVTTPGTRFVGWLGIDARATDVERAALRAAWESAFQDREVFVGGGSNRGMGLATLDIDLDVIAPSSEPYYEHVAQHKAEIAARLTSGLLVPRMKPPQPSKAPKTTKADAN